MYTSPMVDHVPEFGSNSLTIKLDGISKPPTMTNLILTIPLSPFLESRLFCHRLLF